MSGSGQEGDGNAQQKVRVVPQDQNVGSSRPPIGFDAQFQCLFVVGCCILAIVVVVGGGGTSWTTATSTSADGGQLLLPQKVSDNPPRSLRKGLKGDLLLSVVRVGAQPEDLVKRGWCNVETPADDGIFFGLLLSLLLL